ITLDSLSKDELYKRGREWMLRTLKSGDAQVSLSDDDKNSLTGTGNILLENESGTYCYTTDRGINFKISVFFKEGRVKYLIEHVVFHETLVCMINGSTRTTPQTYPFEQSYQATDEERIRFEKKKKKPSKRYEYWVKDLRDINNSLLKLVDELNKSLSQRSQVDKDDW
ncbi:MAG: DUF4468 domain-containing protein, partial [Bacteroidia bacterium]